MCVHAGVCTSLKAPSPPPFPFSLTLWSTPHQPQPCGALPRTAHTYPGLGGYHHEQGRHLQEEEHYLTHECVHYCS